MSEFWWGEETPAQQPWLFLLPVEYSGAIEQAELTRDLIRTSPGFALNCTVSFTALQKRMPRN